MADRLVYQIGSLPCFNPPRLHTERVLGHHHAIDKPAAALGAAELQILQWHIARPRSMIGRPLVVADFAPHAELQHLISTAEVDRHALAQLLQAA